MSSTSRVLRLRTRPARAAEVSHREPRSGSSRDRVASADGPSPSPTDTGRRPCGGSRPPPASPRFGRMPCRRRPAGRVHRFRSGGPAMSAREATRWYASRDGGLVAGLLSAGRLGLCCRPRRGGDPANRLQTPAACPRRRYARDRSTSARGCRRLAASACDAPWVHTALVRRHLLARGRARPRPDVQNLRADPNVRVLVGHPWHRGTAVVLPRTHDRGHRRRAAARDRGRRRPVPMRSSTDRYVPAVAGRHSPTALTIRIDHRTGLTAWAASRYFWFSPPKISLTDVSSNTASMASAMMRGDRQHLDLVDLLLGRERQRVGDDDLARSPSS